jgi:regulator of protease activity HflC (stomatin/prohibitin superfamily)
VILDAAIYYSVAALVALFLAVAVLVMTSRKDGSGAAVVLILGAVFLAVSFVFKDTVGVALAAVLLPILITGCRVIPVYSRGVVLRLGNLRGVMEPGFSYVLPLGVDAVRVIDTRTVTIDVPKQEIITKDNIPVVVDAVVYFNVSDPILAATKVVNFVTSTSILGMTTLRSILGQHELDEILSKRQELNLLLRTLLDEATDPWGLKVTMVEVKSIELPDSMKRAMARQAEAERERRAKVISAEGELQASSKLAEAAGVMAAEPATMQLRYLQALSEIAAEQNSTIVFPVPVELLSFLKKLG